MRSWVGLRAAVTPRTLPVLACPPLPPAMLTGIIEANSKVPTELERFLSYLLHVSMEMTNYLIFIIRLRLFKKDCKLILPGLAIHVPPSSYFEKAGKYEPAAVLLLLSPVARKLRVTWNHPPQATMHQQPPRGSLPAPLVASTGCPGLLAQAALASQHRPLND